MWNGQTQYVFLRVAHTKNYAWLSTIKTGLCRKIVIMYVFVDTQPIFIIIQTYKEHKIVIIDSALIDKSQCEKIRFFLLFSKLFAMLFGLRILYHDLLL